MVTSKPESVLQPAADVITAVREMRWKADSAVKELSGVHGTGGIRTTFSLYDVRQIPPTCVPQSGERRTSVKQTRWKLTFEAFDRKRQSEREGTQGGPSRDTSHEHDARLPLLQRRNSKLSVSAISVSNGL